MKFKIHTVEFRNFIKDFVNPTGLFKVPCALAVTSMWRPRLTIHCSIGERHLIVATWRHGFGATLAQVMACCLMAPSHYLNQC